jgi:hypothetical protein
MGGDKKFTTAFRESKIGTKSNQYAKLKVLKDTYFVVVDGNGHYRPIMAKEYSPGFRYPRIFFVPGSNQSPFVLPVPPLASLPLSSAPVTSFSFTSLPQSNDSPTMRVRAQDLTEQQFISDLIELRNNPTLIATLNTFSNGRPGYCERCHSRFEKIGDHVLSARHRRVSMDLLSWRELDRLVELFRGDTLPAEEFKTIPTSVQSQNSNFSGKCLEFNSKAFCEATNYKPNNPTLGKVTIENESSKPKSQKLSKEILSPKFDYDDPRSMTVSPLDGGAKLAGQNDTYISRIFEIPKLTSVDTGTAFNYSAVFGEEDSTFVHLSGETPFEGFPLALPSLNFTSTQLNPISVNALALPSTSVATESKAHSQSSNGLSVSETFNSDHVDAGLLKNISYCSQQTSNFQLYPITPSMFHQTIQIPHKIHTPEDDFLDLFQTSSVISDRPSSPTPKRVRIYQMPTPT